MGRLLVVDDAPDVRRVIVGLLEREGYTAAEATTGREVASAINDGTADLILLDVMLDGESGFEVLAAIRRTATSRSSCSPPRWRSDRVLGLRLGADDYRHEAVLRSELAASGDDRPPALLAPEFPRETMRFGELSIDTTSPRSGSAASWSRRP